VEDEMKCELVKANTGYSGLSISEEACKLAVEKFTAPVPVYFAGTKLVMGHITSVEYNTETKSIFGEVDLEVVVMAGVEGTQSLDCPDGKLIVAGEIKQGVLAPKSIMPGGQNGMAK
jgi:hypothetical protein